MSLINEALKKAQRERSGHPGQPIGAPPAGTPPASGPAAPHRSHRSNPWPVVLVMLALVGGGTAVWFLKPATAPQPVVIATADPMPATPPPGTTPVQPTPADLQINIPGPATATATAPIPTSPAPVSSAPVPEPPPTTAVPAPAPEPLKITLQMEDPRVLAFLDAARINGIRSVADDAKLLMNNKVFRAGAVVDRELGLKLAQILPNELVFEDARGIQYRKVL